MRNDPWNEVPSWQQNPLNDQGAQWQPQQQYQYPPQAYGQPPKRKLSIGTILCAIWLAVTVGFALFSVATCVRDDSARTAQADAVVTLIYVDKADDSDDSDEYYPVVRFTDENGEEQEYTCHYDEMGLFSKQYEKGDKVRVEYEPGNPKNVKII